jgi:acetyltransferase-like isoleucine patch superfamily enzyme
MQYKDITVVVQGSVKQILTQKCLESIRKHLPMAKIILSTWQGEDVTGLDFDDLILSEVISETFDCFWKSNPHGWTKTNNMNRQIISTQKGLSKVVTKYALKFRTDISLTSDTAITEYFHLRTKYRSRNKKFSIFQNRILSIGTGNQDNMNLSYHLSDLVQFGLTEDIKALWDIPLLSKEEATYCEVNNLNNGSFFAFRYACEQKLLLDNVDKSGIKYAKPNYYFDTSDAIKKDSEQILINNFIFLSTFNCGMIFSVDHMNVVSNTFAYFFEDFIRFYGIYCGDNFLLKLLNGIKKNFYKKTKKQKYFGVRPFLYFKKTINDNPYSKVRVLKILGLSMIKISKFHDVKRILADNFISKLDDNGNLVRLKTLNDITSISGLTIHLGGKNNVIKILSNKNFHNTVLAVDGENNIVTIEKDIHCIDGVMFFIGNHYNNRMFYLGKNAMIMSGTNIYLEEHNARMTIGNNFLCSNNVLVQNSDGHVICDINTGYTINKASKDFVISDNVWLGRGSAVLKNAYIPKGAIVGARSVVTKQYYEENIVLAGSPAKIVKSNIKWSRDMFHNY